MTSTEKAYVLEYVYITISITPVNPAVGPTNITVGAFSSKEEAVKHVVKHYEVDAEAYTDDISLGQGIESSTDKYRCAIVLSEINSVMTRADLK